MGEIEGQIDKIDKQIDEVCKAIRKTYGYTDEADELIDLIYEMRHHSIDEMV